MSVLAAIGEGSDAEQIVSVSYDLATTYGDSLLVLHVVPEEDYEAHKRSVESATDFRDFSLTQETDSAARFARRVVSDVLDGFDSSVVSTRGRIGDPAAEVLAEAESVSPRFLVIGGRRRSPVGKAVFGSSTQEILLNAQCPVVTVLAD